MFLTLAHAALSWAFSPGTLGPRPLLLLAIPAPIPLASIAALNMTKFIPEMHAAPSDSSLVQLLPLLLLPLQTPTFSSRMKKNRLLLPLEAPIRSHASVEILLL